jgi:fructose-1,6-bisphosphatase II
MLRMLQVIEMDGVVAPGEADRWGEGWRLPPANAWAPAAPSRRCAGRTLEGGRLLAGGYPGAISAVAVAPAGAIRTPAGIYYMEKIVVNEEVASALVPECLDAPAAWTLALVARAKGKQVRDLVVFVLDRPRHADLVAEIRAAGAHVLLRLAAIWRVR